MFKAAAGVATDFGRVRDLDELTLVLGRAADVLDASGLMVWMGSAPSGDLRPVLAHGYRADMVALKPSKLDVLATWVAGVPCKNSEAM